MIAPGGGQEPGRVPRGFPGGAEQREGICGQGDLAVCGALASMDLDLEALPVNIGDVKGEGFVEPEAQARDGGEGDLVVHRCGRREEPPDLLDTEDGWQPVVGWCAQERQGVPVALEHVLREEAETPGADAHGRWSKAIDVLAVQEGVLQLLCSDAVGGLVGERRAEAYFPDRGFLGPFAFATEVEGRKHGLTQWAHEISPFVRRVVRVRRKTS